MKPAAPDPIGIKKIKNLVAAEFGISVEKIDSRERTVPLPEIRFVAMVLVRKLIPECAASLPYTARVFNRDHHKTVLNAMERIKDMIDLDPIFRARFDKLEAKVAEALK